MPQYAHNLGHDETQQVDETFQWSRMRIRGSKSDQVEVSVHYLYLTTFCLRRVLEAFEDKSGFLNF